MFESLSIYCLYQKNLVETICYSEMVKPNILLTKVKQGKKKRKKKKVWVKHQCQYRNDRWWRDKWSPQSSIKTLYYTKYTEHPNYRALLVEKKEVLTLYSLKSLFWNSVTV